MTEFARTIYDFNSRIKLNDITTDPTKYLLVDSSAVLDTVSQNTEEPRVTDMGIIDYGTQAGKGIVQIPIMLYASSLADMSQLIEDLKEAFNPELLEADSTYGIDAGNMGYMPFKWTELVGSTSRNFQIYLKSVETPKVTQDVLAGLIRPSILQLKAQDPRKYLQIASNLANAGTANNAGTCKTPCIITITASGTTATNLTITNSTTGESIVVTTALTVGQVLVIDTRLHSVKLDGVERRDYIDPTSDWLMINPGNNTIALSNNSNCGIVTSWRSAWPL